MKKLNYHIEDILYYTDIRDYFECIIKKHEALNDNCSIRIYVDKMEKIIIFKIRTGYHIRLLAPETIKLLGSTKCKKI